MFTVARFDFDNSGNLSEPELAEFQRYGDRVVLNAQQTFQNVAVVSTLLFGATHQSVIGRPAPWQVPESWAEVYSPSSGEAMLVATYTSHVVLECMCMLTLGCCIFFRYMLTNALPTLKAKIAFLIDSNALAITTALAVCVFMVLSISTCLATLLGQPKWGLIAIGLVVFTIFACLKIFARWWRDCILRLHGDVARYVIHGNERVSYMDVGGEKAVPGKIRGTGKHDDGSEQDMGDDHNPDDH